MVDIKQYILINGSLVRTLTDIIFYIIPALVFSLVVPKMIRKNTDINYNSFGWNFLTSFVICLCGFISIIIITWKIGAFSLSISIWLLVIMLVITLISALIITWANSKRFNRYKKFERQ